MHIKDLRSVPNRLSHTTQFKKHNIHTNTEESEALSNQFATILQACKYPSSLPQGLQVHAQTIVNGLSNNRFLGPKIMGMYVLCDRFIDAKTIFNNNNNQVQLGYALPWNWMIRGFNMMGCFQFALLFYFKMLGFGSLPDKYTFPYVIKACGGLKAVTLCKSIHETIRVMGFEMDLFVSSCLIKFYLENGCTNDARCLFDKMVVKDHVLWNVMLNGYAKNKDLCNMIGVYMEMRKSGIMPNSITFACILSACASEALIGLGTQLHGSAVRCGVEMDPPVVNTLVAMYSKFRHLYDARSLFERSPKTDLVTWNGMISGYVQNGFKSEASDLFNEMVNVGIKPDAVTFSSFLPSISEPTSLNHGMLRWLTRFSLKAAHWMLLSTHL